jgi:branched-chain amino acid transport system substrate-binding protein
VRIRRWAVIVALLLTSGLLAGCGDSRSTDDVAGTGGGGSGGSDGGTMTLGLVVAQTGSGSFYGEVMSAGARLAVEEVAADDGVEGWTFELGVEDHKSGDAQAGAAAFRKVTSVEGAPVVLSSFTAPTLAMQPLAEQEGVLLLNGGGIGSDLIDQPSLYNTRMLGAQVMPGLLTWAVEEYDAQRIATLVWDDAAGRAIESVIDEKCADLGCEVVAAEAHEVGATDFGGQLARIKGKSPDVLVLGNYGTDVGYAISQARRTGLDVPIVGNEWTPDAAEVAGDAMEGYVVASDLFDAAATDDPEGRAFVDAYEEANGELPEFYGANYYELVRYVVPELITLAVEDGQDPSAKGVLAEVMDRAAEEGHAFPSVYGEEMVFSTDGTVSKPVGIFAVEGGELSRFGEIVDGEPTVEG